MGRTQPVQARQRVRVADGRRVPIGADVLRRFEAEEDEDDRQADRTTRIARRTLSQPFVMLGRRRARRRGNQADEDQRRSTADSAALTIWRNVISTVAAKPAAGRRRSDWRTLRDPGIEARLLEDLEDAAFARPAGRQTAYHAGYRDADHREVSGGDELREDRGRDPRTKASPRRRSGASPLGGVRRDPRRPAGHDHVAGDHPPR